MSHKQDSSPWNKSLQRLKGLPENIQDYTSYFTLILEIKGVYQPENRVGAAPSQSHIVAFPTFYILFKNIDFLFPLEK